MDIGELCFMRVNLEFRSTEILKVLCAISELLLESGQIKIIHIYYIFIKDLLLSKTDLNKEANKSYFCVLVSSSRIFIGNHYLRI